MNSRSGILTTSTYWFYYMKEINMDYFGNRYQVVHLKEVQQKVYRLFSMQVHVGLGLSCELYHSVPTTFLCEKVLDYSITIIMPLMTQ